MTINSNAKSKVVVCTGDRFRIIDHLPKKVDVAIAEPEKMSRI